MNIYEVIYWGSKKGGNEEDTIYLVRAPDYMAAVKEAQQYARPKDYGGEDYRHPDIVYEIGRDLSVGLEASPRLLRGPYFAFAYNFGWRSWDRSAEDGTETDVWREKS